MTTQEALAILHKTQDGIPFDALDFLYRQPTGKELEEKIIFHLEHAYDEALMLKKNGQFSNLPLWYAILAEAHATRKMADAVVKLFTTPDAPDWDILNEQGLYLVGLLAEKFPEVIDTFLDAIAKEVKEEHETPYLFLYECLAFADHKHAEKVSALLKDKKTKWRELLAVQAAEAGMTECEPALQDFYKEYEQHTQTGTEDNRIRVEIAYALEVLKKGKKQPNSYYLQRGNWKNHYQQLAPLFETEKPMLAGITSNVGRNDLCPCGSGKKYKHCCMKKIQGN